MIFLAMCFLHLVCRVFVVCDDEVIARLLHGVLQGLG